MPFARSIFPTSPGSHPTLALTRPYLDLGCSLTLNGFNPYPLPNLVPQLELGIGRDQLPPTGETTAHFPLAASFGTP
jgi:hypothetical protein